MNLPGQPFRAYKKERIMTTLERIKQLKKEKNAVILAHYYVNDDVQEAADYVGDSYYLSKAAAEAEADVIVFCGVSFMGESAKILNPGKTVLLPDTAADCPMAHMADIETIKKCKEKYDCRYTHQCQYTILFKVIEKAMLSLVLILG